jgi:hypothetical protein
MTGFSFKVNSVFVGLVRALNPQMITSTPRNIGGCSLMCSGPPTIYYITSETVTENEIEKYTSFKIYQA